MAQTQGAEDGGGEFINRLVTDPNNVPDVMRLYGYLGASSEAEHERLYLSADLASFVEIPTSAILHRMTVPKENDPYGAVVLWVKRDAALVNKMAPAAQALAHYFAGAIAAQMGVAQPAPAPAAGIVAQALPLSFQLEPHRGQVRAGAVPVRTALLRPVWRGCGGGMA
jgi:hypothetical protein